MLIGNYTVTQTSDAIFFSAYPIVSVEDPPVEEVKKILRIIHYDKPIAMKSLINDSDDDYSKIIVYKDITVYVYLPNFKVKPTDEAALTGLPPLPDKEAIMEGMKVACTNLEMGLRMLDKESMNPSAAEDESAEK